MTFDRVVGTVALWPNGGDIEVRVKPVGESWGTATSSPTASPLRTQRQPWWLPTVLAPSRRLGCGFSGGTVRTGDDDAKTPGRLG